MAATDRAREDPTLRLPDGRRLGYAEYGDPAGRPIFGFHGTPGSRLMLAVADGPARRLGVRLIAPDRPGMGLSDLKAGRSIGDWPDDLVRLADALGIERFGVAGVSGGGPYALACALRIPERLRSVGVISGVGPVAGPDATAGLDRTHRLIFGVWRRAPWLARRVMALAKRRWDRAPERIFARIVSFAPPQDRPVMTRPEVCDVLIAGLRDAFRVDGRGVAEELILFGRSWGFRLGDIQTPVRLWHGEDDHLVPLAMGRRMAALIPDCRAEFIPGAGHYFVFNHVEPLLRAMTGAEG